VTHQKSFPGWTIEGVPIGGLINFASKKTRWLIGLFKYALVRTTTKTSFCALTPRLKCRHANESQYSEIRSFLRLQPRPWSFKFQKNLADGVAFVGRRSKKPRSAISSAENACGWPAFAPNRAQESGAGLKKNQ
jgi:hypothetical protein